MRAFGVCFIIMLFRGIFNAESLPEGEVKKMIDLIRFFAYDEMA